MDPLEFLTQEELTRFFHCKKTEISCMEEPHTFLHQLRDHNLVPEDLYQKVIKMKCKDRRQEGVYQILDWLEKERGQCVKLFWTCVFKNHILQKYSVFRLLRNSLLDGSFRFYMELPDAAELSKNEKDSIQSKEDKADGQIGGRKRKKSTEETEKREEPGPFSFSNRNQKKQAKKPTFTTPLKKGEKADIWMWDFYKTQLPVTCGDKEGILYRDKLARGLKSIQSQGRWFTASEFEKFAGKGSSRNWKQSIRCQNTPLQKLIEEGHLQSPSAKRRYDQKNQKIQLPVSSLEATSPLLLHWCLLESVSSVETEGSREDHEEEWKLKHEEEEEEDSEPVDLSKLNVFALPVSCGSVSGILYKGRFAGSRSKSIRTEERWFTPEEFVKQELTLTDGHWRKDILCHGKTLSYLVKKKILYVHSLLCRCHLCCPDDPLDQDNDDVCFICNSAGNLVCCDECPRAFHHQCHLPVLQERTLGGNWMCTFCVLKTNQGLWIHMTNEGILNSPVSGNIMRCEYLLLCLYKEDALRVFTRDPTATVPRYTRVISKPMWLDRVKTKLQSNQYKAVREFVGDVRLIFQNCHIFNKDNEYGKMGARLSEIFEREFNTIFKIQ
ncbi:nuclear body protein SP140-like protein isoform X1 [Pangasianodon hypophthalmus]|uniref:nuclear body protein SP140-like protein isoform X1 n=1 Tax=Pangasianodon hypophthalmus TaxID=310915 RepID=UPI002307532E|nr:nuclear body protein SP140-like protein isoform X1 [Pangasianodon hypophthalmus]